ncbi:MAG: ATP-dependent DNA helicase DinG, partial [Gammaproteobacteria bacterium]|nr:ATP-dependent DNA helicase DinG [Gammaproteobacteria bacterium]
LLDHPGLQTLQVSSPFAYAERGLIHIPKLNSEPSSDLFTTELIAVLPTYLDKNVGNLVLFASYWQMEQVAKALRLQGFTLLVQGEAGRQSLLDLHKMKIEGGSGSILFGTQSFSEGLDLPGALLTNLIITKLPFAVPTSPFEEAMAEAVTKRGGNPFLQLTVPTAARKLVQACGRLLRQEQDQGKIVILDRRLVTKSYGSAMLKALPPFRQQIDG